jgi:hypothetical protein
MAPEIESIAIEMSGMIATSDKTTTNSVVEDYNEENVAPTTTGGDSFNVW